MTPNRIPLFDPAAVTVPTLIIDEARVRRNIARMAEKARRSGVRFRPHVKTHQSTAVGQWLRDGGVEAIDTAGLQLALALVGVCAHEGRVLEWTSVSETARTAAADLGVRDALAWG